MKEMEIGPATTYQYGGDIDVIEMEIGKMLGIECSESAPGFYEDHDPLNGRYVNAEHEKMLLAYDKACEEKNQAEQDRLFQEELELMKREAVNGSPLAMFYLGVSYCNGSGVEKNLPKAKELLTKAKIAGVERAETFLSMYFGDPNDGRIIPASLEDFVCEHCGEDEADWMFPNGHDDGEAVDAMLRNKE
jgi:TPR repeat protein